ncbi:RNA-binding region-containing protein 3-like [Dermacentor andersoni]|uniref:RNA-binding region-containing protein 3-like n=1 Tax=Dermacentor andersoni TaxID=34620 RepID=UPI003B3B654A
MRNKCETLLVRHLPTSMSEAEKIDLLKHFGADSVRCMRSTGKLKNSAFATFPTQDAADCALDRLHQAVLMGSRLVVEYALGKQVDRYFPSKSEQFSESASAAEIADKQAAATSSKDEYKSKMEAFAIKLHAMSADLGLDYVLNPMLTYAYPPASPAIVANIAAMLLSVPKFYTQVLHLMNKMNLPAPFGPPMPQPPMMQQSLPVNPGLATSETQPTASAAAAEASGGDHESSLEESEMESDEDDAFQRAQLQQSVIPKKRKAKTQLKRPKLQKLLPPQPVQEHGPKASDVFEPLVEDRGVPKAIAINIRHEIDGEAQVKQTTAPEVVEGGGFGILPALPKPVETSETNASDDNYDWSGTQFLRREEIRSGRISSDEMSRASVFKNYEPGDVASRLYIKNVAKAATVEDLFRIYGGYIDASSEEQCNAFDIRLMKEGRMKGQAFLTLASETQADRARRDTNGYLLKGKPLVVQFARSAKAKKPPTD